MRFRGLAALFSVVAAMAVTASPAMGIQILSNPATQLVTSALSVDTTLSTVLALCPTTISDPSTGTTVHQCTLPTVASISASCNQTQVFANSSQGCVAILPIGTVACGSASFFYVNYNTWSCGAVIGGKPVALQCQQASGSRGLIDACQVIVGAPVVTDTETSYRDGLGVTHHSETLTVGSVQYVCLDDVCHFATS